MVERPSQIRLRSGRHACLLAGAAVVALVLLAQPSPANPVSAAPGPCALPSATPLWIEYGDALTPDVRDVFARKGVIVSLSGTAGAAYFRSHGALTTYFALHLPNLVGPLSAPADPASIPATASKLLAQAIAATGCSTPWIALNELFGSNLPAPWSGGNALYRADVLALMQQLASGGAHPVLLVHGKPTVAGATADWWRQVSQAGDIVYEAYYDADRIYALGPLIGNRRMRLGMRQILADFRGIGIAPGHLGIALGFHTEGGPGVGGRRGLQPREAWLRVVKWEALAARQVAAETRFGSIWSWGWANFSGVDPDKAAAACVYLWTRDRALCDGPAAGGSAFNPSLVEGQIVLPDGIQCSMAGGHRISIGAVRRLTALTGDAHEALTALAARAALQTAARVDPAQVRAVEQRAIARAFHGSRVAYHRALERRHATLAIAREVIRDRLRELAIARQLAQNGSDETTLQSTDDRETAFAHSLICLHDDLPGTGDFPASNELDLGVVPLPALLPFLFVDRKPPVAPAQPVATVAPGQVSLTWSYGGEPDLAGYELARATTPGGPYQTISGPKLLPRPAFTDAAAPMGQPSYYVVRAVDSSGNLSPPSPITSATPA